MIADFVNTANDKIRNHVVANTIYRTWIFFKYFLFKRRSNVSWINTFYLNVVEIYLIFVKLLNVWYYCTNCNIIIICLIIIHWNILQRHSIMIFEITKYRWSLTSKTKIFVANRLQHRKFLEFPSRADQDPSISVASAPSATLTNSSPRTKEELERRDALECWPVSTF